MSRIKSIDNISKYFMYEMYKETKQNIVPEEDDSTKDNFAQELDNEIKKLKGESNAER